MKSSGKGRKGIEKKEKKESIGVDTYLVDWAGWEQIECLRGTYFLCRGDTPPRLARGSLGLTEELLEVWTQLLRSLWVLVKPWGRGLPCLPSKQSSPPHSMTHCSLEWGEDLATGCRGNLALGQSLDGAAAGMVGHYSSSTLEVAQISESSQSTTYPPRVCVCLGVGGLWMPCSVAPQDGGSRGWGWWWVMKGRVLVPKATSEQSKGSNVGACTGSMSRTSWTLLCSQQELRSLQHCFSPPSN